MLDGYFELLSRVLSEGQRRETRTGVDTLSVFGASYAVDLRDGFPLLRERRIPWKNIVVEALWYLSGSTNVSDLQRHGVPIWDAWADESGQVAAGYGRAFRAYPRLDAGVPEGPVSAAPASLSPPPPTDQVRSLIWRLCTDPFSRRHVITAWHPELAHTANPPPCACFQVYHVSRPDPSDPDQRLQLNLHLTQRSADLGIGVSHNIATYALLVHIFARLVGMRPGRLFHSIADAHIYTTSETDLAAGVRSKYDHAPAMRELLARHSQIESGWVDGVGRLPIPQLNLDPGLTDLEHFIALLDKPTDAVLAAAQLISYQPLAPIRLLAAV